MELIKELKQSFELLAQNKFIEILIVNQYRACEKEFPYIEQKDVEFIRDRAQSTYRRFLNELADKDPSLDEDGEPDDDISIEIGLLCDIFREMSSVPESAFFLYCSQTVGMSGEERTDKMKDPAFVKHFEEELLNMLYSVHRRVVPSTCLFDAKAPFPLFCRDLCDLMIEEIEKVGESGKNGKSRIRIMGELLKGAFLTALGCIHALTVGDGKGAVGGWRSLYEQECTLLILHKNGRDILDRFNQWQKYDLNHDREKELDDELEEDKKMLNAEGADVNYRHYGWAAALRPGTNEKKMRVDRNLLEELAEQTERKAAFQFASEVAHGTHALTKEDIKKMQMFICKQLPLSLEQLVDISLCEIERVETARAKSKNYIPYDLDGLKEQANKGLARIKESLPFPQGSSS